MRGIHVAVMAAMLSLPSATAGQESAAKPATSEPTFPAVLFTSQGPSRHQISAAYGEFALSGPKADRLKPLPRGIRHVAYDPGTKKHFGISNHEIYEIDLEKNETTELTPPPDLPELSWTCGVAFDTKRERVVLVTLGGVGHMYSYAPKTQKWELVADMNNLDLAAFTFDEAADRFYGAYQPFGGEKPRIGVFNSVGAMIETIELPASVFPADFDHGPAGEPVNLAPVKGDLAIVTEDRIIAVDLKSGKERVTWTRD